MLYLHDVVGRPWAVQGELAFHAVELLNRGGIAALRELVTLRNAVERAEPAAGSGGPSAGPRTSARRSGAVAVLPLMGLITHRGAIIGCEATASSMAFGQDVRAAAADPQIDAIVLEVDSPGGEVMGVPEAAALIREARASKPVVAHANAMAASAAFWLAAQADEFHVTPSGLVGSVGVYRAHEDRSKALETEGRKVTLISAGKYKVEGNPYEPLVGEALDAMTAEVNRYYDMFVRDVARGRSVNGRKVSPEDVRGGYGEGRVVGAQAAKTQGMVDEIGSLEDAVRRAAHLARTRGKGSAAAASIAAVQADVFRRQREA